MIKKLIIAFTTALIFVAGSDAAKSDEATTLQKPSVSKDECEKAGLKKKTKIYKGQMKGAKNSIIYKSGLMVDGNTAKTTTCVGKGNDAAYEGTLTIEECDHEYVYQVSASNKKERELTFKLHKNPDSKACKKHSSDDKHEELGGGFHGGTAHGKDN